VIFLFLRIAYKSREGSWRNYDSFILNLWVKGIYIYILVAVYLTLAVVSAVPSVAWIYLTYKVLLPRNSFYLGVYLPILVLSVFKSINILSKRFFIILIQWLIHSNIDRIRTWLNLFFLGTFICFSHLEIIIALSYLI